MLIKIIIAIAIIFLLLLGWLVVQSLSRLYAKKHPEFGPAREEGQGCGKNCSCADKQSCQKIAH
ncbi:hypothetical protein [Kaarinaea lacus]